MSGDAEVANNDSYTKNSPFANLKKQQFFHRKRLCPLHGNTNEEISFKNPDLLKKFISERGRILPSRITSVSHNKQLLLARQIKIARYLSILPYQSN
ncbi:Small ribosomal subunit protein bS18 [Candidatus Xenohaliotis californiensis]|uniref:Small ribosomal subunit protein bS18 n=1 Tax=Candidatus Xenohaliotis californiensis TaxID=84677 RepID=A0ABP0ESM2_9RICK|nr:Small ribosomal subunit protein bS18 [Candidatus Xenohaliotis californiensis]